MPFACVCSGKFYIYFCGSHREGAYVPGTVVRQGTREPLTFHQCLENLTVVEGRSLFLNVISYLTGIV